MQMNKDIEKRDQIIFGKYEPKSYCGGVRYFKRMNASTLRRLIKEGFCNPEDCQNCSPSNEEFLEFMEDNDGYFVNGYVLSADRNDYRVSIESIERADNIETKEELEAFVIFARGADEFDTKGYAWWD